MLLKRFIFFELTLLLMSVSIYPGSNNKSYSKSNSKYPLIKDVVHSDRAFFSDIAKRLKAGRFENTFRRRILLYGPPGVGKDEMITALINESDCCVFTKDGSGLVGGLQGSGAETVASIFNEARAIKLGKGVLIVINELQGITPVTSDKSIGSAHKNDGLEHENALTKFWIECDKCAKEEHNNIMVIAMCNQFDRIGERIRGRFLSIEFSNPDEKNAFEILKNKAQYYKVSLTEKKFKIPCQKNERFKW